MFLGTEENHELVAEKLLMIQSLPPLPVHDIEDTLGYVGSEVSQVGRKHLLQEFRWTQDNQVIRFILQAPDSREAERSPSAKQDRPCERVRTAAGASPFPPVKSCHCCLISAISALLSL